MLSIRTAGNEKGFTMVELLVYVSIMIIVLGALYSVLNTNTKSYSSQENRVQVTQDLRAALDLMATEIRMAGYDPRGIGGVSFQDSANNNFDTDGDSIHFTMDRDADEAIANSEDINYYLSSNQILRRDGSGSEPVVAVDITNLTFSYTYFDGGAGDPNSTDTDATNDHDDIELVQISLTCQPADVDPVTGAVPPARTLTTRVVVRNAGLE
jgi:type IV pilus assembly protein PilW